MTNLDRQQQHGETAVKRIPWWIHLYGEITGSLMPLRTRLKGETFRQFVLPLPNAHMESLAYIRELDQIIPPACGHFEFVKMRPIPEMTVDISEITAIGAGKGIDPFVNDYSGMVYASLDDFAEDGCQTEIKKATDAYGMTPEAVEFLLSYYEVRITNDPPGDALIKISWDGRIALSNSGGAHHFSAARYIARRIGYRRSITGKSFELYTDKKDVNKFLNDYIILLVSKGDIPLTSSNDSICSVLQKICRNNHGHTMMYYSEIYVEPFMGFAALVFERNDKIEEVAEMLKKCGAFDVGGYLVNLAT